MARRLLFDGGLAELGQVQTEAGYIKVWTGTVWIKKPVKYWNGTTWVTKPLKYWNGTTWVKTT